jgi:lipoate-protein ligase A
MATNVAGIEVVLRNLGRIGQNVESNVKRAVQEVVLDLQGKAQQLAPIDEGHLRGSANNKVVVNRGKVVGTVRFNERYALIQHEDLSFNHPKGGQAKYLEEPLKRNESQYIRDIEDAVRNGV